MFEKISYVNCAGESIDLGTVGIYSNQNDLRDYKWGYETGSNKILNFKTGIVEKTIPVVICCSSETDGVQIKNQILSVTEKDIINNVPGKIIINDYYMKGYIFGSKKSKYLLSHSYIEIELSFVTDYPKWIKETLHQYLPTSANTEVVSIVSDKVMFKEFPFDYVSAHREYKIINNSISDSNFIMTIYGYVENPQIYIAGHLYAVKTVVNAGERLVITSAENTVFKIGRFGEVTNLYNARVKEQSVFKKIPPGMSPINRPVLFGVDIILFDERSEPAWSL